MFPTHFAHGHFLGEGQDGDVAGEGAGVEGEGAAGVAEGAAGVAADVEGVAGIEGVAADVEGAGVEGIEGVAGEGIEGVEGGEGLAAVPPPLPIRLPNPAEFSIGRTFRNVSSFGGMIQQMRNTRRSTKRTISL